MNKHNSSNAAPRAIITCHIDPQVDASVKELNQLQLHHPDQRRRSFNRLHRFLWS